MFKERSNSEESAKTISDRLVADQNARFSATRIALAQGPFHCLEAQGMALFFLDKIEPSKVKEKGGNGA